MITSMPPEIVRRIWEIVLLTFHQELMDADSGEKFANTIALSLEDDAAPDIPVPSWLKAIISHFNESIPKKADVCIALIRKCEARRTMMNLVTKVHHFVKKKDEGASWAKEVVNGKQYIVISLGTPYNGEERRVILRWRYTKFAKLSPGSILADVAKDLQEEISRQGEKGEERGEWWKQGTMEADFTKLVLKWAKFPGTIVKLEGCPAQFLADRRKLLQKLKAASWYTRMKFARRVIDKWIERNPVLTTSPLPASHVVIPIKFGVWLFVGVISMHSCIRQIGDNRLLAACVVMEHVERCMQLLHRCGNLRLDEVSRAELIHQFKQVFPVSDSEPLVLALEKSIREDTQFQTLVAILVSHREKLFSGVFSALNSLTL
jgi:hypothetical protein